MRFSDIPILILLLAGTALGQSREDIAEYAASYFGDDVRVHPVEITLSSVDAALLSKRSGARHAWNKVDVWKAEKGGKTAGVLMVDNVKGKARPITYLVAFDTAGVILAMEVLAYRESHGGEVRSPLFLEQFAEKSHRDALTVGKDIRNISGATISSRALARGARALAIYVQYLQEGQRL